MYIYDFKREGSPDFPALGRSARSSTPSAPSVDATGGTARLTHLGGEVERSEAEPWKGGKMNEDE